MRNFQASFCITATFLLIAALEQFTFAEDRSSEKHLNARETVEAFLSAGLAEKHSVTSSLSDPNTRIAENAKDLKRQLRVASLNVDTVFACVAGKKAAAFAISEHFIISEPDPDGRATGCLVFTLIRVKGTWLVQDIDFDTAVTASKKLKRFLKDFPGAKQIAAKLESTSSGGL